MRTPVNGFRPAKVAMSVQCIPGDLEQEANGMKLDTRDRSMLRERCWRVVTTLVGKVARLDETPCRK